MVEKELLSGVIYDPDIFSRGLRLNLEVAHAGFLSREAAEGVGFVTPVVGMPGRGTFFFVCIRHPKMCSHRTGNLEVSQAGFLSREAAGGVGFVTPERLDFFLRSPPADVFTQDGEPGRGTYRYPRSS